MSDLTAAVAATSAAAPAYVKGGRYLRGEIDEVFASALIKRLIGDTAQEYKVNLARRVVDAVTDRLKIASVLVAGDELATKRLNELWTANHLGRTVKTLHRAACSEGDSYMFVWGDPDNDQSAEINRRSATTTRVFYDPERPTRKRYASFVWQVPGAGEGSKPRVRVNLLYADRVERYISKPEMKGDEDSHYERFLADDQDEDDWLIDNPYGEVPVFHYRTDEPYGRPLHADAYGPQNAINKLVAVHMSTVDYQGFPQRYRLRASTISDGDASPYPDEDDVPGGVVDDSEDDGLEAGPGTVWDLGDTRSVGAFPAADAKTFLDSINFYARVMGASTATPLRFMDPSGDVPSGESLRADDAPLTEKIGDIQTWFGDEHRAMLRFALKVAGIEVDDISLTWRPVQIVSDKAGWDTVQAKIDAGVPQSVALIEAGYLPADVAEWMQAGETTNLATRVEYVGKIAAAMQGLGTAVALGVISNDQVQQIVAELMGDSLGDDDEGDAR